MPLFNNIFGRHTRNNEEDYRLETALSDPELVLLDTRTPKEYQKNGIPGSINIPHSQIEQFKDRLPRGKNTPIVAYDSTGGRVRFVLPVLQDTLSYSNVVNGIHIDRVKKMLKKAKKHQEENRFSYSR